MMTEVRKGRQTPTRSVVLPYTSTLGGEAIELYNSTGRTAQGGRSSGIRSSGIQ